MGWVGVGGDSMGVQRARGHVVNGSRDAVVDDAGLCIMAGAGGWGHLHTCVGDL